MASLFGFLKCRSLLIALSLLLSFCYYHSYCLSTSFFTFSVLILSTLSPPFFMRRQLWKARVMTRQPESVISAWAVEKENAAREKGEFQLINASSIGRSCDPLLVSEGRENMDMGFAVSKEMSSDCFIGDEDMLTQDMDCTSSACSSCAMSDNESISEILRQSPICTEGSFSDDDSLIEIAIPDGHYIRTDESKPLFQPNSDGAFLSDLLPESVFRQDGLMELLAEISEDDNLIEIDIIMGSIKCSGLGSLGIKA